MSNKIENSKYKIFRLGGAGFTLIELLIVFSVIAIISTIGIASYQKYSDAQKLQAAQMSIKTTLQEARSRAGSQVKPTGCGTFQGYEVILCGAGPGCNTPSFTTSTYELDAICSSVPNGILMASGKLPTGVTVDTSTNPYSYTFIPITGGVVAGGTIVLDGANNASLKITISNLGVIQ